MTDLKLISLTFRGHSQTKQNQSNGINIAVVVLICSVITLTGKTFNKETS